MGSRTAFLLAVSDFATTSHSNNTLVAAEPWVYNKRVKTLYQSLLDYEMGLLQGIASCRAISLNTPRHAQAVERLAEALLSPTATAIVLGDLAAEEREALQLLLSHGGRLEGPRFAREYGYIRPMGPARLAREQPWRSPVNPAEGLWYRGLIFKTFQATAEGNLEMVYIPSDLLPLLEIAAPTADRQPPATDVLEVALVPTPPAVISGEGRLRENMFNLLVYLQTTPVRLESKPRAPDVTYQGLAAKDRQALANCLLPPLLPAFPQEAELEFLLHLGQRAGLLVARHGRLRPDRDPARAWLQAHPLEQLRLLQDTWRADPTWNDLWHVPGLVPQPTGWENSPLLARAKILGFLARVDTSNGAWLSIADFEAIIKRVEPDFQRPGGDYNSWYIYDRQGQLLMGFEHWEQVEGALIRHLLTHILPMLGVVELGTATETGDPGSFCLTPPGQSFLQNQVPPAPTDKKPSLLRVDANFQAHVPARASLYDRFQLARFAQLEQRDQERTVYAITQASVSRALKNGVAAEQITAFLARATDNQTPLKVIETILTWGTRQNTARLEQATLLRLAHEGLLAELRQHPRLGPLLGEVLNPTTILISADKAVEVRRLLMELGYMD
ncbi:MAG: helicase-associated domain-containing protein [Anaerolineae bacterium]|nr:helicase-associated domain-containing protein [Anaerolineae bacterium]